MARPRSDIGPRIVVSARQRFLEEGVDGASLRAIAKEAGTNLGMLYYYFPTKDDLFLAVVESVYANLLVDLRKTLAPELPFDERVRRTFARFAALSDDEFTVLRLVVREAMLSSKRLGRIIARFREGHIGYVLQLLADGYQGGAIRPELTPDRLVPSIAGMLFGMLFARRLRDGARTGDVEPPFPPAEPAVVAEAAAAVLLRGLAPDALGGLIKA